MDASGPDHDGERAVAAARDALPAPDDTAWETVRPDPAAEDPHRDDVMPGGVHQVPAVAAVGGGGAIALGLAGAIRRWRSKRRSATDPDA